MVESNAEDIIEDNGYVVDTDFTAVQVERMMDSALGLINVLAKTSLPLTSGTAGTKTVDLDDRENAAFQILMTIMLREGKKTALSNSSATSNTTGTSSSVGIGGLSASESSSVSASISAAAAINNAANSPLIQYFTNAIQNLREIEVSYG